MKKIFFIFITIALISCEKEKDTLVGKPTNVKSINIRGADYLAISKQNLKNSNNIWSNLYKLTIADSELKSEKVGFYDSNGDLVDSIFTTIQIENIYSISTEYFCMTGSFEILVDSSIDKIVYSSLLVNKVSGDIYDFNGHFPYPYSYYLGSKFVQNDNLGNIYFHFESPIFKLNLSDVQAVSQETYLSGSQYEGGNPFFISQQGNCYYYGYPKTKIKLTSGGIITADRYLKNYFTGSDNKTYCVLNSEVGQIEVSGENFSYTNVGQISTPYDNEVYSYNFNTESFSIMLMDRIGENNIIGDIFFCNPFKTFSVQLPSFITNNFEIEHLSSGNIYVVSTSNTGKQIYSFDLRSIDIKDNRNYLVSEYKTLEFPKSFEIYRYNILENGDVAFEGYDLSNEKDISGILTADNELIVSNTTSDYQFEILQKLH